MAVIARGSISLSNIVESAVTSTVWYYYLQPSTSSPPTQPTNNTPLPVGWGTSEPAYTQGSTNSLYTLVKTTYSTGYYEYSEVCLSSSYEASKSAYNKATVAETTANTANANALQAGQPNISPFYARVPYVAGDYWTGWSGTLNNPLKLTPLSDGWVHVEYDNRSGTSLSRCDEQMVRSDMVKEGADYTFLFEVRNNTSTGTSDFYIVQTDNCQFWGNGIKKNLEGNNSTSTGVTFDDSNVGRDGTVYYKRFVKTSEATGSTHWTGAVNRLCSLTFRAGAGVLAEYDIRVSLYEGEYWGPYKPYVDYGLREEFENLGVGGRNLLLGTAEPVETTVVLNTNNYMTLDVYKTVEPVSDLFEEGDYLTISFDWETTATSGYFRVECGTVTPYVWGQVVKATGGRSPNTQYIDFASDNTSGHFEIVYKVTSAVAAASASLRWLRIRIDGAATSGKTFKISNAKVERGKNASDWIPAPEDVDANIEAAVDGIEVGGRNLLRNTRYYDKNWHLSSATISQDAVENVGIADFQTVTTVSLRHIATHGVEVENYIPYSTVRNKTLTLSLWFKTDDASVTILGTSLNVVPVLVRQNETGRYRYCGNQATAAKTKGITQITDWQRGIITFDVNDSLFTAISDQSADNTINPNTDYFALQLYNHSTAATHIKKVQLEIGNRATDWTPAPEDIDADITAVETIANNAMTAANGKNSVFHQSSQPTGTFTEGDTWFDTANDYAMYTWDGTAWVLEQFGEDSIAAGAIKAGHIDAGAVTADKIAANAITAEMISGKDITGGTLKTTLGPQRAISQNLGGGLTILDVADPNMCHIQLYNQGLRVVPANSDSAITRLLQVMFADFDGVGIQYGWAVTTAFFSPKIYNAGGRVLGRNDMLAYEEYSAGETGNMVTGVPGVTAIYRREAGVVTVSFATFSFAAGTGTDSTNYQLIPDLWPLKEMDLVSTLNGTRFRITTNGYIRPFTAVSSQTTIRGTFTYLTLGGDTIAVG